jgi:hypothetical protein
MNHARTGRYGRTTIPARRLSITIGSRRRVGVPESKLANVIPDNPNR